MSATENYDEKTTAGQGPATYRDRLASDINNLDNQRYRSARALHILTRHPEFEELIELLGLIRVPIRTLPIFAEKALVLE